jgi:hypothetical protein
VQIRGVPAGHAAQQLVDRVIGCHSLERAIGKARALLKQRKRER